MDRITCDEFVKRFKVSKSVAYGTLEFFAKCGLAKRGTVERAEGTRGRSPVAYLLTEEAVGLLSVAAPVVETDTEAV